MKKRFSYRMTALGGLLLLVGIYFLEKSKK